MSQTNQCRFATCARRFVTQHIRRTSAGFATIALALSFDTRKQKTDKIMPRQVYAILAIKAYATIATRTTTWPSLETELGAAPVATLVVVADLVVRLHAEPLRDLAVLARLAC